MVAVKQGNERLVALLLRYGADRRANNRYGLDAIDVAKADERSSIIQLLKARTSNRE
jgi:ankyrin repeat protein